MPKYDAVSWLSEFSKSVPYNDSNPLSCLLSSPLSSLQLSQNLLSLKKINKENTQKEKPKM